MNPLILILLAAFVASPVYAEPKKKESGFTKVLKTMFPSAKPKVVPKRTRKVNAKSHPTPTPETPTINRMYVPVEVDWMAKYWEQEAAWDYYIPEDNLIRFVDGKYVVPIVVYKHYEGMVKTPRRMPTPSKYNPVPIEG